MSPAIAAATTPEDHAAVRSLLRGFRDWLDTRYDPALMDLYYPRDGHEALLEDLPRLHAPPDGTILLARLDGRAVGCTMIRRQDVDAAELKRMFVAPEARGHGVGLALCDAAAGAARAAGYRVLRLDTGVHHHEATALYRRAGFVERDAYVPPSPDSAATLRYFERSL